MYFDDMNATAIEPRHEIRDEEKLARLTEAFADRGWDDNERDILVYEQGIMMALTGTHRLAAAAANDMDVPVCVIEGNDMTEEQWEELLGSADDDDLLWRLEAYLGPNSDAAKIMRAEIDAQDE